MRPSLTTRLAVISACATPSGRGSKRGDAAGPAAEVSDGDVDAPTADAEDADGAADADDTDDAADPGPAEVSDCVEGTACAVACFGTATCQDGECVPDPDSQITCPAADDPCIDRFECDPSSGACDVPIFEPQGADCDADEDVCTLEGCDGQGSCQSSGEVEQCATQQQNNPCWTWTCNKKTGCLQTAFLVGGSCDDGNPCSVNDTCITNEFDQELCLGSPVPIDDGNVCTSDACVGGEVLHEAIDGVPCDPDDPCDDSGLCEAGECVADDACDCEADDDCEQPADPCLVAVCDAGSCGTDVGPGGEPCDDGDACTTGDVCDEQGGCDGAPIDPDDGNACTLDSCADGIIANEPADGLACVATDPCDDSGQCQGGSCVPDGPCEEPTEDWLAFSDLFGGQVRLWKPDGSVTALGSCHQPWGLEYVAPDKVYAACVGVPDTIQQFDVQSGAQVQVYQEEQNHRDVAQGPDGKLYVAVAVYKPFSVQILDPIAKTTTPYVDVGAQENMGLAVGPDGTLFWGDIQGDGKVFTVAPNAGPQSLIIQGFPSGYSLRDLDLGPDGNLYIVGLSVTAGLQVFTQAGTPVAQIDMPGKSYGVALSSAGTVYAMVDAEPFSSTGAEDGIYAWDGEGWSQILGNIAPVGGIHVIPK